MRATALILFRMNSYTKAVVILIILINSTTTEVWSTATDVATEP